MIAATPLPRQSSSWQHELAQAITDPDELCALLGIDSALSAPARAAGKQFRLRVPRGFVRRMRRCDPDDPLLRQVLPAAAELDSAAGYGADPLAEAAARRAPGLLQKYRGRALLMVTGACGVHCRYCFRREYPYADDAGAGGRWQEAIGTIADDTSIEEVILSGGDPLSLSNERLEQLGRELGAIGHLRRLRIHTRQPIVLPERVDTGLCLWLRSLRWRPIIVLHTNHGNEIDDQVVAACGLLRQSGATLLNQSVLLSGINDSAPALANLSHRLWDAGVLPYYLHLLDRVRGASHFEVTEQRARRLYADLLGVLPGYLVPRLVREVAGAESKLPLAADWTVPRSHI